MHLRCEAIILSSRAHGEHGAVVRALTPNDGLRAGYVRGARSRRLRPLLQPADLVMAEWRSRTDEQLASLAIEPIASRAALHAEPLAAAALEWVTALTACALPEAQPYPRVHTGLDGLLLALEAAPSARGWVAALARYELLMLAELGFGLDLGRCAVTGSADDLVFISPRSGIAVSQSAGAAHAERLFALPRVLLGEPNQDWADMLEGLRVTGHFLARDLLVERRADALAARTRLVDRLKRAVA